jgi:hypothetical protein
MLEGTAARLDQMETMSRDEGKENQMEGKMLKTGKNRTVETRGVLSLRSRRVERKTVRCICCVSLILPVTLRVVVLHTTILLV